MNTRETLEAARAAIADPAHWITGDETSVNKDGHFTFCALGAIRWALTPYMGRMRLVMPEIVAALADVTPAPPERFKLASHTQKVAFFNDTHTHGEVLELFDTAILKARETEAGEAEDLSLSRAQVALGRIEKVAA